MTLYVSTTGSADTFGLQRSRLKPIWCSETSKHCLRPCAEPISLGPAPCRSMQSPISDFRKRRKDSELLHVQHPHWALYLTLEKCLVETPPQRSRRCLRMASVPDVSGPWSRASERRNSRLYLHDEQGEPESTDFGFYFGSIPMAESGCYQERQHPSLFSKGVVRRLCLRLSRLRLRAACRNARRR